MFAASIRRFFALAALVATAALVGCAEDRESCIAEASMKPTDMGVRVAMAQCNRKYPAPPGGYSPNDRPAQPSDIDKFLGTKPAQPGMFDDLIPPRRLPDMAQQMLPVTSVTMAVLLTVFGVIPWPMNIGLWALRLARLICLTASCAMGLRLYIGGINPFPAELLWVSIVVNTLLFVGLWWLINWLHRRRYGADHPALASSPWAL